MSLQDTIVLKFGGASLSTPERILSMAAMAHEFGKQYARCAIVVSAMGKMTDELIDLAKKIHPNPPKRELDMMVSVGERISMALVTMALETLGVQAVSFTGSQSGIITSQTHTDARIIDVTPKRVLEQLMQGRYVIVAGFQGVSRSGEITTLGRGGSDTSAVALGIALGAKKVIFFKDVAGIYTNDPKKDTAAVQLPELSYEDALFILKKGSKVLHERSVLLAQSNNIPLEIRSFLDPHGPMTSIYASATIKTQAQYETALQ